jgi:ribosomal protein L24E
MDADLEAEGVSVVPDPPPLCLHTYMPSVTRTVASDRSPRVCSEPAGHDGPHGDALGHRWALEPWQDLVVPDTRIAPPAATVAQGAVTHIAGQHVTIDDHYLRQRCAWCGVVLLDYDLHRVAVPVGQEGPPATWPGGALVTVAGGASWIPEGEQLPDDACARQPEADHTHVPASPGSVVSDPRTDPPAPGSVAEGPPEPAPWQEVTIAGEIHHYDPARGWTSGRAPAGSGGSVDGDAPPIPDEAVRAYLGATERIGGWTTDVVCRDRPDDFDTLTIGAAYQYGYRRAAKIVRDLVSSCGTGTPAPPLVEVARQVVPGRRTCSGCGDDIWPGETAHAGEDDAVICVVCEAKATRAMSAVAQRLRAERGAEPPGVDHG